MKNTLLALLACVLLATTADAKTGHKKSHKHSGKPTYYYNSDGTMTDKPSPSASDAKRPSPYKGDNVPDNDGQKKNKQRNLNYNSGQALPANNGK